MSKTRSNPMWRGRTRQSHDEAMQLVAETLGHAQDLAPSTIGKRTGLSVSYVRMLVAKMTKEGRLYSRQESVQEMNTRRRIEGGTGPGRPAKLYRTTP